MSMNTKQESAYESIEISDSFCSEEINPYAEQFYMNEEPSEDSNDTKQSNTQQSWFQNVGDIRRIQKWKSFPWSRQETKEGIEQPEAVISGSKVRWACGLLIHVIPVLAASVIIAINLQGYFIGTQFVGTTDAKSSSMALLALQMTAKLFEITVVASLGFMILEHMQSLLFFSESGLPLGLSGAYFTFTNLFYFGSPSFWHGIGGLNSWKSCIRISVFLISCGLLANSIGPSAAVLLVPNYDNNWPAGGLRFHLTQEVSSIWPMSLNESHIGSYKFHVGGSECFNPSGDLMDNANESFSSCIWYASTKIGASVDRNMQSSGNFTVEDYNHMGIWQYLRSVSWFEYSYVTWSWSTMSVANVITSSLAQDWMLAAERSFDNYSSWNVFSKYTRYSQRDHFGSQASLAGMLGPMARTQCIRKEKAFDSVTVLHYPATPLLDDYYETPLLDDYSEFDANFTTSRDLGTENFGHTTYMVPTDLMSETSSIRALWIAKPADFHQSIGKYIRPRGSLPDNLPSAFLVVQIPTGSTTAGTIYTCSVDARWTNVTSVSQYFDDRRVSVDGNPPSTFAKLAYDTVDVFGHPLDGQTSTSVNLDLAWLNQLTPSLNKTSNQNGPNTATGYNSLSRAIATLISDNETNLFQEKIEALKIEALVAMLVVDGMSRHNLEELMGGIWGYTQNQWLYNIYNWIPGSRTVLLAGGGGTNAIPPSRIFQSSVEFLWSLTISGYSYSANSTASIFALVVLFTYITFALGHIIFSVTKRWTSTTWMFIPEIIALCQNSSGSELLRDTAISVGSRSTRHLFVRARASEALNGEKGEETIHAIVSKRSEDLRYQEIAGYSKIQKGKKYL